MLKEAWPSDEALLRLARPLGPYQAEFLSREHDILAAALLANEESGELRVNLFLGLVAATIAGLAFAADALRPDQSQLNQLGWAVVAVAAFLLLFGLATLRRILHRNIASTEFLNGLRVLRAAHIMREPTAVELFPIVASRGPIARKKEDWFWGAAGYVEIVALANASLLFVASAVTALLGGAPIGVVLLVGVVAFLIGWFAQVEWCARVYTRETIDGADKRKEAVQWWTDQTAGRPSGQG